MHNHNNKFEILIEYVGSMLNFSFEELKIKYIRYPICLTINVENRVLGKNPKLDLIIRKLLFHMLLTKQTNTL